MNQTLERILTYQGDDEMMRGIKQNLMANRLHDESASHTFERLQRNGQIGRLMVPVGTDPRLADPEFVSLMPE